MINIVKTKNILHNIEWLCCIRQLKFIDTLVIPGRKLFCEEWKFFPLNMMDHFNFNPRKIVNKKTVDLEQSRIYLLELY